jgi:hypothetical protein
MLQQKNRDDARLFFKKGIITIFLRSRANTGLHVTWKVKAHIAEIYTDIILIQSLTIFF